MDIEGMVKEFTGQLKDQKATIVELEKQLDSRKELSLIHISEPTRPS